MIVYRAKFAPTIWAARQLVNHGHIKVNGRKLNIASARISVGHVIELGTKAQEMALVIEAQGLAERDIPEYVVPDGATKVTSPGPDAGRGSLPVRRNPIWSSNSIRADRTGFRRIEGSRFGCPFSFLRAATEAGPTCELGRALSLQFRSSRSAPT